MLGPNLTLHLNPVQIRSFTLVVNNFVVLYSYYYSIFSMQGFFRIFNEGRFMFRLELSIIGPSKTAP